MPKLEPYPDLKLDLTTAYSLLDPHLTDAESWEVYATIVMGEYDEALSRMRELAGERRASEAAAVLAEVVRRAADR